MFAPGQWTNTIFLRLKDGFFSPNNPKKSRSILYNRSRSLRLFRKGKTRIIAIFHTADLVICSHSGERKIPSYSRIYTVPTETCFKWTHDRLSDCDHHETLTKISTDINARKKPMLEQQP